MSVVHSEYDGYELVAWPVERQRWTEGSPRGEQEGNTNLTSRAIQRSILAAATGQEPFFAVLANVTNRNGAVGSVTLGVLTYGLGLLRKGGDVNLPEGTGLTARVVN